MNLTEEFGAPPFSVLDARQGYWQKRKRQWLESGIASEQGRGKDLMDGFEGTCTSLGSKDTSIFDPMLCELLVRWFSPVGGLVLDPFAGGSVRGIVSARLGREYVGIDVRQEQIEENYRQSQILSDSEKNLISWIQGDSNHVLGEVKPGANLLLSCPPYYNLEIYSENPADLSTAPDYESFLSQYREIVGKACALLENDSFACFVVGDIRDRNGVYRDFTGDTKRAFLDCGLSLYNDAVLITAVGSASMRANRFFTGSRKMVKTHQNVLVFVKGSWKKSAQKLRNDYRNTWNPEPESNWLPGLAAT